jgi:hypothetical protein
MMYPFSSQAGAGSASSMKTGGACVNSTVRTRGVSAAALLDPPAPTSEVEASSSLTASASSSPSSSCGGGDGAGGQALGSRIAKPLPQRARFFDQPKPAARQALQSLMVSWTSAAAMPASPCCVSGATSASNSTPHHIPVA